MQRHTTCRLALVVQFYKTLLSNFLIRCFLAPRFYFCSMTFQQKPTVALLVHSCDRYQLLYQGFETFFNKYWPLSIPCNYYFATENLSVQLKGFKNIQSGSGQWSDRLRTLLKKIEEPYILYFQEDMWLDKPVNTTFFDKLFALAKQENWQQVKLHSSEVYKTNPTGFFIDGFNISKLDNAASDFLMSHQITLWNKQFLLQQMAKDEHPWRNERKGTKRLRKLDPEIYQVDYFSENGKPAINQNKPGIERSGYFTVSENSTLNIVSLPYIETLKKGSEANKKYAAELQNHYNNQLTHDGKPKPRKEDIFKKIKRKLSGK